MHELSICQSLIGIIVDESARQAFSAVKRVRVEVGCLAAIEPRALMFAFDVAAAGTVCEGAILDIVSLPGTAWCFDCGESQEITERFAACPGCGGARLQVSGGEDLRIKDLEVL